jgi:hypothetical protein
MRKEVTEKQLATRPQDTVDLCNRLGRFWSVVKDHVGDDSVDLAVVER